MCPETNDLASSSCSRSAVNNPQQLILVLLLATLGIAVGHAQQSGDSESHAAALISASNTALPANLVVLKVGDMQVTQAEFETMVSDLETLQGGADLPRKARATTITTPPWATPLT
jgi:hypothetical protein